MLARAGLYGSVTEDGGGYISNMKIVHVWVKVTIDGDDYEFDPSFKSHTKKNGLSTWTLEHAIRYDLSDFLDDAEQGSSSGDPWVKDLNKANIQDNLTTYSENLIDYIKETWLGALVKR